MNSPCELNLLLSSKQSQDRPVSKATLEKYAQQYKFLTKTQQQEGDWITSTHEKDLVNMIKDLEIKSAGKMGYLNVIHITKELKGQPIKEILKYRNSLFKTNSKDIDNKIKEKQDQNLPSYLEIEKFINSLYKNGEWIRWLYNYLIFIYGLRNKDVNLIIINADRFAKLTHEEKKERNFLVVKKTECELVIDNYKTKNAYGTKHIKCRSRKVLAICNKLGEGRILQKTNGELVGDSELSYYIRLYMTADYHLTEADYFKITLLHIQSQPNSISNVFEICKTRGTKSLGVIDKYYNLSEDK